MKTQKGFSIGEVLVAVFILLVGIVDAVFLTVRSISDVGGSRDAVVAALLAQEGVELVRNVRDNIVTERRCGDSDTERCKAFGPEDVYGFPKTDRMSIGNYCTIDMRMAEGVGVPSKVIKCGGDSVTDRLYLDKTGDLFYTHDSGGDWFRGFQRRIYFDFGHTDSSNPTVDNAFVDVISVVVYGGGAFDDVTITDVPRTCLKSRKCAYARTRLTSWINYGD